MRVPSGTVRYTGGVALLLTLAATLFAAAVPQVRAAAGAPPRQPGETRTEPSPFPAAPTPIVPDVPAGSLLEEARRRLELGARTPAQEVDRWAVRLATAPSSPAALRRFARYRALIEEALRTHALPADLAFLPWVESEWLIEATSRAGAAGMWQLMPATARGYGLEVSAYVDERRDPVRSTHAAVRHLADLHRATGDWHATLAAYNAGLGRAGHTRGAFWRRRGSLPAETRAYVPQVLAAARVGRSPDGWGLRPGAEPPLRFRELWVPGGTPLESVARSIGVAARELRELNPHLVRGTTPPGRRWPVRLPVHAAGRAPAPRA